jgi:septum formation protein
MQPPRLILASSSPRRAAILTRLGLEFDVLPAAVDEAILSDETAAGAAERLARLKAAASAREDTLTLGCDTLVEQDGRILAKPGSPGEAREMVERLSGGRHQVYTGIALATTDRLESTVERTQVWFRALEGREIEEYVATGEPLDKAGAYGIQGYGAAVVSSVEGDFFNVMGLPVQRLLELLRRFGWRYAFDSLRPIEQ